MFGTKEDRIVKNTKTSIEGIDGSAVALSTVDVNSASGQKVLSIADTTGFVIDKAVLIDKDGSGGGAEVVIVASIQAGTSLTMKTNLEFAHTLAQADAVIQDFYYNTVAKVVAWDDYWLHKRYEAAGVVAAIRVVPGTNQSGIHSGQENQTTSFHIVISRLLQNYLYPTDLENNYAYTSLVADVKKALMGAPTDVVHTRGGYAWNTKMPHYRPLQADDFRREGQVPKKILPLVGAYIHVDVDWQHAYGDSYV